MKKDLTHLVLVIDRSGSMYSVKDRMDEAINGVIQEQKLEKGECTISIYQFDSDGTWDKPTLRLDEVCHGIPIAEAPQFNIKPSGGTPLIDATCKVIDDTGSYLASIPERWRPGRVIFVIVTDGNENTSVENTKEGLNKRIERQRDTYKWTFMFLGANQDAIAEAQKYGIKQDFALTYASNAKGLESLTGSANEKLKKMRSMDHGVYALNAVSGHACSFDAEDRAAQVEAGA